jgi:hypothetical protein
LSSPTHHSSQRFPPLVSGASRASELARLDAHFVNVLGVLRAKQPRSLSRQQRRARGSHIERLDRYRRRRLFPKNERFPGRRLPHFIDAQGTRCAMGHLIELSGGRDLVRHIASTRNYARIRQLVDLPELVVWLEENGLTLEEAALIQPEYCGPPARNCLCGNGIGQGFVEGNVGDGGSELIVTAVYGPITQVKAGDVLPVQDTRNVGLQHDVLFASLGGDARTAFVEFGASNGEVSLPTSACWFPQVARIPGPLPLALVTQALSQPAPAERATTPAKSAVPRRMTPASTTPRAMTAVVRPPAARLRHLPSVSS